MDNETATREHMHVEPDSKHYWRLLVLSDGSDTSDRVWPAVRSMIGKGTHIKLVTVAEESAAGLESILQKKVERFIPQAETSVQVRSGPVIDTIAEETSTYDPHLVCLSTHGRSGLNRLVLGSVTSELIHRSPNPLLLVGPHFEPRSDTWSVKRILVPLDGSAFSEEALPVAKVLSRHLGAPAKIVQVATAEIRPAGMDTFDTGYVAWKGRGEWPAGVEWDILHGNAPEAIISEATEVPGTLVVITTHGRSGVQRALGSVTDSIVRHYTGAMVVVPPLAIRATP